MKKFWLFAGSTYYPKGGMLDFRNSYDTLEEAIKAYEVLKEEDSYNVAWAHILNNETSIIVFNPDEDLDEFNF